MSLGVKLRRKISNQWSAQLSSTVPIRKLLTLTQIRRTSLLKLWKEISAHVVISLIENTEVNQFVEDYFEYFYLPKDKMATDQTRTRTRTKTMTLWLDKFQAVLEKEIVKLNTMNTFGQILKCDHYVLASEIGNT